MSGSKISLDEVRKVARLARLSPTDAELSALQHDLDAILGYVASLNEVDTEGVEPSDHALTQRSPLRPDSVREGLSREVALAAAPVAHDGGFSVPKVLEVES
jgi:aspartyl-tRNA(Asn)/glutamyl-tRNA(Gln) amidotransferase subunit C